MANWRIPLSDLDYGAEEEVAVLRVLKSRWLSMGPEVQAFEKEFAEFIGAKHAFAVANATAGLHLSLLALELGPGDEVIQPAMNFVAAANMTVAVGATPVFGDIVSLEEPTLDPNEIERGLTPRTKAVVVMHYGGYLCRMAEIVEICRRRGLALIEDACHAIGAAYFDPQRRGPHGRMAGALGDVSAFSFFGNKNLATGEGGMVVTDRDDIAERIKLLRSHGMTTLTWDRHEGQASSYEVIFNGYNYRFDDLHAALGRVQLGKLKRNNKRRAEVTAIYRKELQRLEKWSFPFKDYRGDSAHHLLTAVAPDPRTRQIAKARLAANGIQTSLHYPCITDFKTFARYGSRGLVKSRIFSHKALSLPLFPTLAEDQVEFICSVLGQANI